MIVQNINIYFKRFQENTQLLGFITFFQAKNTQDPMKNAFLKSNAANFIIKVKKSYETNFN